MARDIPAAIRELCLGLPETTEVLSHGTPDFRVAGKTFASFCINHHGDGHVALWLQAQAGAQQLYCEMEPEHYFVPPYVGPKGWLGVELNQGIPWESVIRRVLEAYAMISPAALETPDADKVNVAPPERPMSPEEIDPFLQPRAQSIDQLLEKLCTDFPETSRASTFGTPVWKAGKKTFVGLHFNRGRLAVQFWVGTEQQSLLCQDSRYSIPAYTGHNGWINLDVHEHADANEVAQLTETSYRHFALKRMLKAMDG